MLLASLVVAINLWGYIIGYEIKNLRKAVENSEYKSGDAGGT